MTTTAAPRLDAEPAARFTDLIAAEWLKFVSLRSTRWGVLFSAVVVIGMNAYAALSDYRNWPTYNPQIRAEFVPYWAMHDAFTAGAAMVTILATGTIGVLAIVSDYASGLARTTFAAVPARSSVVLAKATVLTAVLFGFGVLVAGGSFAASQGILAGRGINVTLADPGVLQGLVAVALLPPVCGLAGLALGALVRHVAASLVTAVALLLLFPALLDGRRHLSATLLHAQPYGAWSVLHQIHGPAGISPFPATPAGCFLTYGIWALAAVVVAALAVRRRDL
ncbi:ABC transporter permease [Actinocatenispora thailandica]|uniref:ABC transporter permease n=1 Tax=Actinocatenispora thailandica TaxID=227318 RepID=A0A7R7DV86_9ACTN|nr:ABC transporter permease [Actinocatenispora thailandica]BCJ38345.1 ABC transporter permease [Actinocatenispora thailandica]